MGAHERRPGGRVLPPPPSEPEIARRPGTAIPQRERITFLVRLAERFPPAAGLMTAFTTVDGYPVLHVIPHGVPGRAISVGCRYRNGRWWFYNVRTGVQIRPANDLDAAARLIAAAVRQVKR
ncbi:hypothetical protein SAMN05443665_10176 [Actinomadura meyerae]|uniref:Uncharacterized protein n=1 Tax=Actinomadura meyerae TaxID=240840 RepID=A0A239K6U6_9ACTN|nr:hypothetical protein [Actinomadura meyerae]SNT13478.1 hypothetical protein SAMN05443665_10176 [Actinomadura meyerae]